MHFLYRNRHFLLTVAVVLFAAVMAVRQFQINQSGHTERLEDFILLQEQDDAKLSEHRYQLLVQELPELGDKALVDDLRRTAMLVDPNAPQRDSLLWKYHVSLQNELRKRAERRLRRVQEQASRP